jgi:hypothetical protein
MRLRRAVPKIPAKSSVPLRLPLHKNCSLLTPSKSTLLQLLIPLHFISLGINTYKKPGRGPISRAPIFCKLVTTHTSPHWSRTNARNSIRFMPLLHDLRTPGVGVPVPNEGLLFRLDLLNRQLSAPNFRLRHGDFSLRSFPPCFVASFSSATMPSHPGAVHA